MPYYIYRVAPLGVLHKLDQFERFIDASAQAKALRAAQAPGTPDRIKVMFGENELQAEDLLSQVREAGPAGDD